MAARLGHERFTITRLGIQCRRCSAEAKGRKITKTLEDTSYGKERTAKVLNEMAGAGEMVQWTIQEKSGLGQGKERQLFLSAGYPVMHSAKEGKGKRERDIVYPVSPDQAARVCKCDSAEKREDISVGEKVMVPTFHLVTQEYGQDGPNTPTSKHVKDKLGASAATACAEVEVLEVNGTTLTVKVLKCMLKSTTTTVEMSAKEIAVAKAMAQKIIEKWTNKKLETALASRDLDTTGVKKVMVGRLAAAIGEGDGPSAQRIVEGRVDKKDQGTERVIHWHQYWKPSDADEEPEENGGSRREVCRQCRRRCRNGRRNKERVTEPCRICQEEDGTQECVVCRDHYHVRPTGESRATSKCTGVANERWITCSTEKGMCPGCYATYSRDVYKKTDAIVGTTTTEG